MKIIVKRYRRRAEAQHERRVMESYLDSPSLVRYYGFRSRRGMGYIHMEWARGDSLRKLIRERGPLPPTKVIAIARVILMGVAALHRSGYVHGDLHPGNVIVTDFEAPAVKLIDFQHAVRIRRNGRARARRRLAAPPLDLAPESRRRWIDRAYDLYGVGFMCAAMLIGREPKRRATLTRRRSGDKELWAVIRQAVQRDPKRRYRTAVSMMRALRTCGDAARPRAGARSWWRGTWGLFVPILLKCS